jgi:arsenate reductase
MDVIIWHNPRCSKSRETLALLEDEGHEVEERLYLVDMPTKNEILDVLDKTGLKPSQLIRRKEALFKELGLADADEDALLIAMVEHPKLIERPIVLAEDKAAIGRPPEAVLDIL